MAASKQDIEKWFKTGVAMKASHMIVVCDDFDWEDYPVYVVPPEDATEKVNLYNGKDMQRVMELYNLSQPMEPQIDSGTLCFNL